MQRVGIALGVLATGTRYTPDREAKYTIADMVAGWGVAESVVHHKDVRRRWQSFRLASA